MPAVKSKARKTKVTVRDLGQGASKELGKESLRKVRGGMMAADARKPKPTCEFAGEKCGTLHVSPRSYSGKLTVVIKTS